MQSSGRGIALEYHCRGGHVLAVVVYFPADQDLDMVRSILAWVMGVMAPRRGVYTLMMRDLNANPGWATGFRHAPAALTILREEFMQDTGLTRCHPTTEVPMWTDGGRCVGVIDHILHGRAPKEGRLWLDEASPFPSDHRRVVWDVRDTQVPEDRPPVPLRAKHFPIRNPGITGSYHAALSTARREEGPRPEGLAALYEFFRASTIRAVESAHAPPPPPGNSGSSWGAWTRSIVSSRHTLRGAHGGGSRWTRSKSGWIYPRTWRRPGRWETCSGTSPVSRRWPPSPDSPVGRSVTCTGQLARHRSNHGSVLAWMWRRGPGPRWLWTRFATGTKRR